MRRRSKAALAAGAALLVCLAGVAAYYLQRPVGYASVPSSAVPAGWRDDGSTLATKVGGLAKIRTHAYAASELGQVTLVALTPIPLVDLEGRVDEETRATLAKHRATATPAGTGSLTVAGLELPFDEFSVSADDGSWQGRLFRLTYRCPATGDFVAAVGFGVTTKRGFGRVTYTQAQDMVESSTCG